MSATLQLGWACRVSAATPAVCGDAIDVPEIVTAALPLPLLVETMLTPGAVMSGFRPLSPFRGPPDEKLAKPVKFGFGISAAATTAPRPFAARSLLPSVP